MGDRRKMEPDVNGGRGEAESEGMEKSEADGTDTHHVIETYTPALEQDLAGEAVDKGEPELQHKKRGEVNNGRG